MISSKLNKHLACLLLSCFILLPSLSAQTFEIWKAANFNASEQLDDSVSGLLSDPDGTGVPNLVRYALGLDRTSPASGAVPRVLAASIPLQVGIERPIGLTDVTYRLEFSSLINPTGTWDPGTLVVSAAETGFEMIEATDPVGGPVRFARLRIIHSSGVEASPARNLNATPMSPTEVNLTWEGGASADGFLLEQSTDGGEFEIIGFVPSGTSEFTVRNLIPGEAVTFRSSAVGQAADSTPSNEEVVTPVLGDTGAVLLKFRNSQPNGERVIPLNIRVENSTSTSIPLQELTLRYWMDYDTEEPIVNRFDYSTTSASNGANISESISTVATPLAQPQPGATHTVDFVFSDPDLILPAGTAANPGFLRIEGILRKDYSGPNRLVPQNDFSHLATAHQDPVVHPPFNILRNGELIFGIEPGGGSGGAARPNAPVALRAIPLTESSIELTWQDEALNETLFVIERDFLEEPGQFKILTTVDPNSTSFQDTGLLDEADYRYRIRTVNADGVSAATNIASVRTLEGVSPQFIPVTPENFTVTAFSDRRVDLSWSDLSRNERGFIIERQEGDGSFTELTRVNPGTTSFIDFGLEPATSYTYRITAFNLAGNAAAAPSSGSTAASQAPNPPTDAEIMRFLRQATFGAIPEQSAANASNTQSTIAAVRALGFEGWLDSQFALPATLHTPSPLPADWSQAQRVSTWWQNVLTAPDQVRQRLAFALSQIFVISENDADLADQALGMTQFYDLLVTAPESNFRELLEDVTFSPVMGKYLDHTQNQKANGLVRPDENYAREIMQLFSIGLIQLNLDGTPKLDDDGNPLPTYNQRDIEQVARVFTGLTFAGSTDFLGGPENFLAPMVMFPEFHETGRKNFVLLNSDIPDIAADGDPLQDLELIHDGLAGHASTAPFISRQLIQRTVTSNPSPAYIQRVATVFETTNGDLKEVFKAVLLDYEARSNDPLDSETYGKQREPLIRIANLLRALDASAPTNGFTIGDLTDVIQQSPLRAPTVFNFFEPDFSLPGDITRAGLASPEFQTTQSSTVIQSANYFNDIIFGNFPGATLDFTRYEGLATDTTALIDQLSLDFLDGGMPASMRLILENYLSSISGAENKAKAGLYLVVTSPQFTIEQ